jgi:hypothetical protein
VVTAGSGSGCIVDLPLDVGEADVNVTARSTGDRVVCCIRPSAGRK